VQKKISSMLLPIVKKIEIISLTEVNDPGETFVRRSRNNKIQIGG